MAGLGSLKEAGAADDVIEGKLVAALRLTLTGGSRAERDRPDRRGGQLQCRDRARTRGDRRDRQVQDVGGARPLRR